MGEKNLNINKNHNTVKEQNKETIIRNLETEIEYLRREKRHAENVANERLDQVRMLVRLLAEENFSTKDAKQHISYIENSCDDLQALCGKVHGLCSETYRYDDKASGPVKNFAKKILDILERK